MCFFHSLSSSFFSAISHESGISSTVCGGKYLGAATASSCWRNQSGLLGFWIFTLLNLIWPGEGRGVGEGVAARRDLVTRRKGGDDMVGEEKAKLACKAMLATFLLRTEEQSGVAAQGTRQPKYARRRQLKLPHMQGARYNPKRRIFGERINLWNIDSKSGAKEYLFRIFRVPSQLFANSFLCFSSFCFFPSFL